MRVCIGVAQEFVCRKWTYSPEHSEFKGTFLLNSECISFFKE